MAKSFRAIETRNTSNRVSFIISTFGRFILHLCLFDLFQTTLQILPLPGLGTTKGGSVYNKAFPSPLRYGVSTIAVLSTGAAVYAGLEVGHNVITLIGVGLLQLDPADHPPIFSKPWLSTSLRDLWSRRWHSVFRNYFAILGYAAGHRIMGEVGGVLGVFFLSGLLHDWTIWGMGKGTDFWRIVGFFYLQGIGMCVEATFSVVTGRKIRGWWGRAWTCLFMLTTAHLVVEAWLQRGLAGGIYFVKPEYRPVLKLYQYFVGRQCIVQY
ncbi:hypothetical protein M407DRAFT_245173 [Tulasnella calospora MUT 4182]|uniref:Wax synthase domain-containing protein n=1 Tax=Tulasnella calospora MUT 4182 TaxID=1051891 RepID=A0A0C3QCU1_9AGAM|nr:hypothetical protein M407DRAFT_245173 [Tulasnella calospora MUT 4182]